MLGQAFEDPKWVRNHDALSAATIAARVAECEQLLREVEEGRRRKAAAERLTALRRRVVSQTLPPPRATAALN